jgi:hypothetical protein
MARMTYVYISYLTEKSYIGGGGEFRSCNTHRSASGRTHVSLNYIYKTYCRV